MAMLAGMSRAPTQLGLALTSDVLRGVCRLLRGMDLAPVPELVLPTGRRLDVCALSPSGEIVAVEIKVSVADFRADAKWPGYLEYCDRYFFAVPEGFPPDLPPAEHGLIVADRFGAAILRAAPATPLSAPRRKAMTLRLARAAAERWHRGFDPDFA